MRNGLDPTMLQRLIDRAGHKEHPLAAEVYDYLKQNYKPEVLDWVKGADWKLTFVHLADINYDRRPGGRNMDKVNGIADAVRAGKPMEPVVLVDRGKGRLDVADGMHRTEAFDRAGRKTIQAYVGSGDVSGYEHAKMHAAKTNVAPGEKAAEADASTGLATAVDGNKNTSPLPRQGAFAPRPPGDMPSERYPTAAVEVQPKGKKLKVMVADTPALRATGLQNRDDLGDYDGMLFRWPALANSAMHNANVAFPVSAAWFDSSGAYVDHAHMLPGDSTAVRPKGQHQYALEVHSKDFDSLGLGPGASISIADEKRQDTNGSIQPGS